MERRMKVVSWVAALLAPALCLAGEVKTLPTAPDSLPKCKQWFARGIESEIQSFGPVKDSPETVACSLKLTGKGVAQYLIPFATEVATGNSYRLTYKVRIEGLPDGCRVDLGYLSQYFPDRASYKDTGIETYPRRVDGPAADWLDVQDTITLNALLARIEKKPTADELARSKMQIGAVAFTVFGQYDGQTVTITFKDVKVEIEPVKE